MDGTQMGTYFNILSLTPARPVSSPDLLRPPHRLACQGKCELTLQRSWRKNTWQFSTICPLTCTVLLSPGGRSHSLTAFCWSQELACSVKHKGFCSTVLRSPAYSCSPETILTTSLDVLALISCGSDGNPTHAEPEDHTEERICTQQMALQYRALLLPAKPSTSVSGCISEQLWHFILILPRLPTPK